MTWDGKSDRGKTRPAGVYFCRTGGHEETGPGKMRHGKTMLRHVFLLSALLLSVRCGNEGTRPVDGDTLPEPKGKTVDVMPLWSPADTARIGFTHAAETFEEMQRWGEHSIWIVNTVTGEKEWVTDGMLCDWSPDGNQLLFTRPYVGALLRDLRTGEESQIPVRGAPMDWSPNGTEIAYISWETPQGLYILDLHSLTSQRVAPRFECDWSPDGQQILCDSLIVIDRTGRRMAKVPYGVEGGLPAWPRWSPDGGSIAYGGYCGEHLAGILVISREGKDQRVVACPGALPSWRADGKMLAYSALAENRATAIWVINIDGTGKKQVTFPSGWPQGQGE